MGGGKDFDGQRAHTPEQQTALNQYSDRFRDYCNQGDPMCAVGSTPISAYAHLGYFVEHKDEVAEWVAGKAVESNDKVSSSSAKVFI
jgi:acetylxylan esterase